MGRALIVSAGASSNEYLSTHLAELGYSRPIIVPSGAEARRRMLESNYELIVVNAPLPDEFGHELCISAVEQTDAGVVFLVKAAAAEQLMAPVSNQGVLLLSKPFTTTMFLQAIHMAAASNHRLKRMRAENLRLQDKIAQIRLVSRAKCCLIETKQMTEAEAHRYIEKQAMDTRRDRAEIAQEILDSYDGSGV
ncbi:MAG: ANTAR domain-containing response regulator [Faecalibacterium sp.]